jgi:hypothetical protein
VINTNDLSKIEILDKRRYTYRSELFYFDDSGMDDKTRIIIFSTSNNMKILSQHNHWYVDGTFDITPTMFTQLFSIHVYIKEVSIPLLYALLPNQTEKTYTKLFQMVKGLIDKSPLSIKSDFELAIINAARKVFKCNISCCFFHLSQSLVRKIQQNGLFVDVFYSKDFRLCHHLLKSLAFVPVEDVVKGFELVKAHAKKSCSKFQPIKEYFERNYITGLKKNSKTIRNSPRYAIEYWFLHER